MLRIRFERAQPGGLERVLTFPDSTEVRSAIGRLPSCSLEPQGPNGKWLHERGDFMDFAKSLFDLALGEEGAGHYARHKQQGLWLRFEEDASVPETAALPWEIMHDGRDFLALDARTAIVRALPGRPSEQTRSRRKPLKMLLFWASPSSASRLFIEREQIALAKALAALRGGNIEIHDIVHCTPGKLTQALRHHDYDIVHFSGHGSFQSGKGCIWLQDGQGEAAAMEAEEFVNLFVSRKPPLVILNCCQSGQAGPSPEGSPWFSDMARYLLAEGFPDVAATICSIADSDGTLFARAFLPVFGDRLDVCRAMAAARQELDRAHARSKGTSGAGTPFYQFVHFSSGGPETPAEIIEEAAPVRRVKPRTRHGRSNTYRVYETTDAPRNYLMDQLERGWSRGVRVAGVYGVGGMGKTAFAAQAIARFPNHPDANLRVDACMWLDFKSAKSAGPIVEQIISMLEADGHATRAKALRDMPSVNAQLVTNALSESYAERHLLVLDNLETVPEMEPKEREECLDLVKALTADLPDWLVLITSRDRVELGDPGREAVEVSWIAAERLSFFERAVLVEEKLPVWGGPSCRLTSKQVESLIQEVAVHPLVLRLFLNDLREGGSFDGLLPRMLDRVGEEARLDYYLGKLAPENLRVLQVLCALVREPASAVFKAVAPGVFEFMEWPAPKSFDRSLASLRQAGLMEQGDPLGVLPVVRRRLLTPLGEQDGLALDEKACRKVSAAVCQVIDDAGLAEKENIFALLGLDQALELGHPLGSARFLRAVSKRFWEVMPFSELLHYTKMVHGLLESYDFGEDREAQSMALTSWFCLARVFISCRNLKFALQCYQMVLELSRKFGTKRIFGDIHHQIGIVYAEDRNWEAAIFHYKQALKWKKKTGMLHELGRTYHQFGMAHAGQNKWRQAMQLYNKAIKEFEKSCQPHEFGGTYIAVRLSRQS